MMTARRRRTFTAEFKARTVELVRTSGKSVGDVCRELDLTETKIQPDGVGDDVGPETAAPIRRLVGAFGRKHQTRLIADAWTIDNTLVNSPSSR